MTPRTPHGRSSTAFHLLLAAVGWGILAFAALGGFGSRVDTTGVPLLEILPFLGFGLVARSLSFRIYAGVSVSVDSAFYIAAVLTLGTLPAAWLVTVTITADAVVRLLRDRGGPGGARPLVNGLAFLLSRGAVPGALVVLGGAVFGVDQAAFAPPLGPALGVLWLVPALSLILLVPHYLILGVGLWLEGHPPRRVLTRVFLPALGEEMLLVPLSMVIVLVYDPGHPFLFVLLGCTFVLVNLVVKLLAEALGKLGRRVGELEILGDVGRAIAANLDLAELLPQIARETQKLVGNASKVMVAIRDERAHMVALEIFDQDGVLVERDVLPDGKGLTGRVIERRETLLLDALQAQLPGLGVDELYNDASIHSWMGTPLTVQDQVIGILNVQSEQPGAYTAEQARIFETIAAQAAVAIQNARLYALATVDGLTGLFVRRYFDLRLSDEVRLARRYGSGFAVLLLDLDDFKALNDRHGHQAGDRVLVTVARTVQGAVRESDIACRYGGEELAVVMPRASVDEAARVAERVRADVEACRVEAAGERLSVTASIGVAAFERGTPDADDVVRRADEALYRAKERGKNRVEVDGRKDGEAAAERAGV